MSSIPSLTAATIIHLLNSQGQADYIGESISQLAHSLQAAHLATQSHADDETILAALLHDIGQFLPASTVMSLAHDVRSLDGNVGRAGHERIGAEYLSRLGFSSKVSELVGSHVAAKRFLCAVEPEYWETLSEASRKSLVFQGGPMDREEVAAWRAKKEICDDMCRLRKWDDAAKVVGLEVAPTEAYEGMIVRHLERKVSE